MLEKIKSIFYIRILLSHLNEKVKLGLIKYNKFFQNIVDINLINYKAYTDKYINYENERKGKLYNVYDERLLFEGEFLNGERWNGKGIEDYDLGYFEGEYLNGKHWNGEGEEYNEDGILIYKGKYLEGKKVDEDLIY